jgi:hypothetical protein
MNIGRISLVSLTLIACSIDTAEKLPLKVEICSIARWQEVLEKDINQNKYKNTILMIFFRCF